MGDPLKVGTFKIEPFYLHATRRAQAGSHVIAESRTQFGFALFEGDGIEPLAVCLTERRAIVLAERLGRSHG